MIRSFPKKFIRRPLDELDEDKIVFYDIETNHQYAAYAKIKMRAWQQGLRGKPELVETPNQLRAYRQKMESPDIIKVDFNGLNFDRIVERRHGVDVHPQNAHDIYQQLKTISPNLPAYSMKFAAFYYLGDMHFPQMELDVWCAENGKEMWQAPKELLARYNKHDVNPQTVDLFRMTWDVVIRDDYWNAYMNSLMMDEPLSEMEIEGGLYLDEPLIWKRLHRLQKRVQKLTMEAIAITHGKVQNPNSSKQLGEYFSTFQKIELGLTDSGEFCVDKKTLVDLKDDNRLAWIAFKIREANGTIKYYENYLNALADPCHHERKGKLWIPVQFSVGSARTGRFTSQSLHKLNFQNPNEEAKEVQVVPKGNLGWWIDATQIENVVHIFESKDYDRRAAYEADPKWNEYVWLCNRILGTCLGKDELDDKEKYPSPQIPNWSIYKQYKTGKLGLNFGMGIGLFCELFGLEEDIGRETFADIHRACPAIHELQNRVAYALQTVGYVTDVFGKRYTGPARMAYKVVAYLIQGCGTGSLPRAQIRANWETLRRFDSRMPARLQGRKCGVMCGTTHDENSGRIRLDLGAENILQLLQKLMFNMTDKFSPLFDNIPLRAKLYLSRTNAGDAEEVDITDTKRILQFAA